MSEKKQLLSVSDVSEFDIPDFLDPAESSLCFCCCESSSVTFSDACFHPGGSAQQLLSALLVVNAHLFGS